AQGRRQVHRVDGRPRHAVPRRHGRLQLRRSDLQDRRRRPGLGAAGEPARGPRRAHAEGEDIGQREDPVGHPEGGHRPPFQVARPRTPVPSRTIARQRERTSGRESRVTALAFFGTSVALGFVAWGILAARYLWPALRDRPRAEALRPLLLLHSFRFIGLAFLVPGVVSPDLPGAFARPAAYGDLLAALLALLALPGLQSRPCCVSC